MSSIIGTAISSTIVERTSGLRTGVETAAGAVDDDEDDRVRRGGKARARWSAGPPPTIGGAAANRRVCRRLVRREAAAATATHEASSVGCGTIWNAWVVVATDRARRGDKNAGLVTGYPRLGTNVHPHQLVKPLPPVLMSSTTKTAKANLRPASWSTNARNKTCRSNTGHLSISQDPNGAYRAHIMTADGTQTKRLRTIPEALVWKDREERIHDPEDFELRIVLPSLLSSSSSSPSGSVVSLIRLVFCSHESVSLSQCERPPALCFDCVSQRWPHVEPPTLFVSIQHTVQTETDAWVETPAVAAADDDDDDRVRHGDKARARWSAGPPPTGGSASTAQSHTDTGVRVGVSAATRSAATPHAHGRGHVRAHRHGKHTHAHRHAHADTLQMRKHLQRATSAVVALEGLPPTGSAADRGPAVGKVRRDSPAPHGHRSAGCGCGCGSVWFAVREEEFDQSAGARVVSRTINLAGISTLEERKDLLGKFFAELYSKLIEGVDGPDEALDGDLVFVHGDECAEGGGGELLDHDGVGGAVALEHLGLEEEFVGSLCAELGLDLGLGLAKGEGLGLCEEVGEEDLVVLAERVLGLDGGDKVAGDELGALVDELIEGVLAVGACLTPDDGAGLVVDALGVLGDELAVGLHVALLEVVCELVHVLVVGEDGLGLSAEEVDVPDAEEGEEGGEVLLERGVLEVEVHLVCAEEELLKVVVADDDGDGEADGGPERVSAADPVPELEHVLLRDAKVGGGLDVGAECDKVLGDVRLVLCVLEEPVASGGGVGDGLLSGEGLGGDDEEGGLGVADAEGLGHVGAVDVGDKVGVEVALGVGLERLGDHDGAEVGATDADVDDALDGLAGVTLVGAGADGLGELLHVLELGLDLVDAGLVDLEVAGDVAEGDVEDGAALGGVDVLAGEHGVDLLLDLRLLGEGEELVEHLIIDEVLGEVEEEASVGVARVPLSRVLVEALRVGLEGLAEVDLLALGLVELLQLLPRGQGRGELVSHGRCCQDVQVVVMGGLGKVA
ncbi:hypothetical protein L1887_60923 [Cichorium endivia]|nr:hypothetical protein L1887_60923 [Cichorium endivia]